MHSVILGFPATALHEATAAAVARVLEAHELEVEWAPLPSGLPSGSPDGRLASGGIDLFVSAWLPRTDAALLAGGMQPLGLLYRPALIWCIAAAGSAHPSRIDQLAGCDSLERRIMVPTDTPIAAASEQALAAYGLDKAGYFVERAPEAEALAWAKAADASLIVPLCRPHALLHASALQELRDPLLALGAEQQARLLIRRDLREQLDQDLIDELDELTLGNKVVSAMAHAVQFEGMGAEAAADAWQRGKLTPRG